MILSVDQLLLPQPVCRLIRFSDLPLSQVPLLNYAVLIEKTTILFEYLENSSIFASAFARAFSSAGSEHLPYKQRVGGSNPSTPTGNKSCGNSSVGRASASQAEGREFEPRFPLFFLLL